MPVTGQNPLEFNFGHCHEAHTVCKRIILIALPDEIVFCRHETIRIRPLDPAKVIFAFRTYPTIFGILAIIHLFNVG